MPVQNHLVYIAVRSYVWLKGYFCYGLPEGQSILTIKTIIYGFQTDEEGNIQGTIWAAPPFDQGMPYIEYVDTRVPKIDTIICNANLNPCNYAIEDTPYGIKEPNSIFYPLICLESTNGEEIPCFEQSFDPVNLKLNLNVLYREEYEERTFFFQLEKNLSNVAQKWAGWGIGDTCLPLRGAYVKNWTEVCKYNHYLGCVGSHGFFTYGDYDCNANVNQREGTYYNPTIKILIVPNSSNAQEVKWMKKLQYHEAGHWLYWLMKDKNFEDYELGGPIKCKIGSMGDRGTLAEAYAESHIFEFLYARYTGYGTYEVGDAYEIDTMCEIPFLLGDIPEELEIYYKACYNDCNLCNEEPPISKVIPQNCPLSYINCSDYFARQCTDTFNNECNDLPVSAQASLLRDIYDSANHPILDGSKDQVVLPISQMYHCLKGNVSDIVSIGYLLEQLRFCTSCEDLEKLIKYYNPNINFNCSN